MANKDKIFRLSKYQMAVLYYKSTEGATHEEIARKLDRDVKTVQSHMSKIYEILEIKAPGKSRKQMDSELKNEICPIIRQMFPSFEDVKRWAPRDDELPPPARRRINWRRAIPWIIIAAAVISGVAIYPVIRDWMIRREVKTQVSPKDQMTLIFIPAGEFKMGSSKIKDWQTLPEEIPQHTVYMDDYWIDQTEVTNAQYAMCVAAGSCTKPNDTISLTRSSYYGNSQYADYPVIYVSWSQAADYCGWAGRRLPTEAMWEKAARGPYGRTYPWGNTFRGNIFHGTKANYCDRNCDNPWKDNRYDDGYIETSPVGDYPAGASLYGALDMAGNAYEWVADWYEPYRRLNQKNPTGPLTGTQHVIRGGSWGDDRAHVRTAVRSHENMPDSANFIGFRCAK